MPSEYGVDELYFGSVPVHLCRVAGETIAYNHEEWTPLTTTEDIAAVVRRARPVGPEDDIIEPAIPALNFGRKVSLYADVEAANPAAWPEFMRQPLLKVTEGQAAAEHDRLGAQAFSTPAKAFASGTRSCTLKIDGKWYRLKGCGNNDSGFVVSRLTDASTGKETRQVREHSNFSRVFDTYGYPDRVGQMISVYAAGARILV